MRPSYFTPCTDTTGPSERPERPSLGRLTALCPDGPFQEPPAHTVIAALLAKHAKSTKTAKAQRPPKSRTAQNTITAVLLHKDIDVLAARGLYNKACSPLLRLPDDILVHIMVDYLGWEDILCLRHASRVFLRLFGRKEFALLQDNNHTNNTGLFVLPTPWPSLALPVNDQVKWSNMWRRLTRDQFECDDCHRLKIFGCQPLYMHCTACNADHPNTLFSAAQRKFDKETTAHRVCVGHEGHVRLCAHKTVTLAEVLAILPGRKINNHFIDKSSVHQRSSAEHDLTPFSLDADLRIICDHPSHSPQHHWENHAVSQLSPPSLSNDTTPSLPPYSRFISDTHAEAPSFAVNDAVHAGVKHKVITWSYTAHLDLTGLGDPENSSAISAQAFRDRIHELRKGHSPARYIAPEDFPGILQELRCVDPDRCGCLLYPGFLRKRSPQASCEDHEVVRQLVSRTTDLDNIRVRLVSCDKSQRCLKIMYSRTIRLQGFHVNPAPNWPPAIRLGRRLGELALFRRMRDALHNGAIPSGWYQALDPRSYSLADDTANHHLTWCRGKQCRLNPFFLRERYVRMSHEMNVDCRRGCESNITFGLDQTGNEQRQGYFIEIPNKEQWMGEKKKVGH